MADSELRSESTGGHGPWGHALEDVRVLDLLQFEAGSSTSHPLAWLGADVVKVETPNVGEPARSMMAKSPGVDSTYFATFNNSKRSITLNLKSDRGREIFRRLVPRFDVVAENFTRGTMEKFGLGYDELKKLHPGLIYYSVRGFGDSGPWADYKAFDPVAQAAGGAMALTGMEDGPPMLSGAVVGDSGAGIIGAMAILAALHQRARTGHGQKVDISMQEAVTYYTRTRFSTRGQVPDLLGRRVGDSRTGLGGLFACAPGGPNDYVTVTLMTQAMWAGLLTAVGGADLAGDEQWKDYASVRSNPEATGAMRTRIEEWTRARTKFEVTHELAQAGVPVGPVLDHNEVFENEQLRARDMIVEFDHPQAGKMTLLGAPFRLSASPPVYKRPPMLGEHTRELLQVELGMSDLDLEELRAEGVV